MANGSFDRSVPSPARVWNYWVGGKDNFEADRAMAEQIMQMLPAMPIAARLTRQFLVRSVRYLASEHGVRQFLDIGSGLPTADNTHEVAQRVDPSCRIVYADNDPVVISHAGALLASTPEGRCDYLHADLHDLDEILAGAARTLDFTQPVAVIMLQVLQFVHDDADPYGLVKRLMSAMPAGSFLVMVHAMSDDDPQAATEITKMSQSTATPLRMRTRQEVARFFDGLELLGPGVASSTEWLETGFGGADGLPEALAGVPFGHNAIARKP